MPAPGPIVTVKAGSRSYVLTSAANGQLIELGPAGTTQSVSTLMLQVNVDALWNGQFVVMGRTLGAAADAANVPFEPIPYRRVSLNNVAQEYAIVSDAVGGNAILQIPANGMSIALLVAASAGMAQLVMWDLQGPSSI